MIIVDAPVPVVLTIAQLQTIHRDFNRHTPLRNEPLRWADEGKDGYDCKGHVVLEAALLHARGIPWDQMQVLIVGRPTDRVAHAVLQVGAWVLDDGQPNPIRPANYQIRQTVSAARYELTMDLGARG